jgi:hypothetical protein
MIPDKEWGAFMEDLVCHIDQRRKANRSTLDRTAEARIGLRKRTPWLSIDQPK